jgi:hypothetical protein
MKKYIIIFCSFLLFISNTNAQVKDLQDYFQHVDKLLHANVKAGKVNYKNISADKKDLDALVSYVAIKQKFSSPSEEKAFYLNAYNVLVIKGIINNYPTKGPMEIAGFFDKKQYTINGSNLTLNNIENDIVRKKFNDARIHFALVCGAKSCPPIQSYAFKPEKLNAQLELVTKQSMQNTLFTKIDSKNKKATISMLFNWYKDDFIKAKGSVLGFINSYLKSPLPANTTIENYTYDWALNG